MDGSDLGFESIVHESMTLQMGFLVELGTDDDGVEGLAAAAGHVFDGDVGCVEFGLEGAFERVGGDARFVGGLGCLGVGGGGHWC